MAPMHLLSPDHLLRIPSFCSSDEAALVPVARYRAASPIYVPATEYALPSNLKYFIFPLPCQLLRTPKCHWLAVAGGAPPPLHPQPASSDPPPAILSPRNSESMEMALSKPETLTDPGFLNVVSLELRFKLLQDF
jgi:hypothetical protein